MVDVDEGTTLLMPTGYYGEDRDTMIGLLAHHAKVSKPTCSSR